MDTADPMVPIWPVTLVGYSGWLLWRAARSAWVRSFKASRADCNIQQAASASRRRSRFARVISASTMALSTARVDSRSSCSNMGISRIFIREWAKSRTESQRGPILPSMFNGHPSTKPPTDSVSIIANSSATSGVNFVRYRIFTGEAILSPASDSARPMVFLPMSSPNNR